MLSKVHTDFSTSSRPSWRMSRSLFQGATLPSSVQAALRNAGYETVDDVAGVSAEALSAELGISVKDAENLVSATQTPKVPRMTQSAASLARMNVFTCKYPAVNKVLGGGLLRSHVLEISGPPGSFKEALACDFVQAFVQAGEEVVFVDMQNMTSPHALSRLLESMPSAGTLLHYIRVHTLPDILVFLRGMPSNLCPKTGLLVLNSLSFVFQSHPDLSPSKKNMILGNIRNNLLEACVTRDVTVIITSQMATKILHPDGSPATFDSGAKAVMVPRLGIKYLPLGRSFRIIIVPQSRRSGYIAFTFQTHVFYINMMVQSREACVLARPSKYSN
ncbi:hypothetical protein EDC04DRAFT_3138210 [Pisolithus marmoratus]|nr:hypothetical protein EDC04DRAFT_3138210 [Pisolithus marmoratus]